MKIFLQSLKVPLKKQTKFLNFSYKSLYYSNFYKPDSLKRIHNRLLYDEFDYIKNNEQIQKVIKNIYSFKSRK